MVIRNRELTITTQMIEAIIIEQTWTFSTKINIIIIINSIANRTRGLTTMLLGMITEIKMSQNILTVNIEIQK